MAGGNNPREREQGRMEKILESPLDCKEIQPVHSEGNQSRVSRGSLVPLCFLPLKWYHLHI